MRAGSDCRRRLARFTPRFRYRRVDALPPLAWCAELCRGEGDVVVRHGRLVETETDAFFEGVWDGPFADFAFLSAHTTMGSGGCVDRERVCFAAPSHTYESLVTLSDGDRMWVSNSIAFILASAGDGPDLRYPSYHRDLLRLQRRGITGRDPAALPTARGRTLLLHAATDLFVDARLAITTGLRLPPPEPRDFSEYRSFLAESVAALVRNAGDRARSHRFPSVTTTSTGYDSPAISVLAAEAGVRDAITFESRPAHPGSDSGRSIAEALGLTAHPIDPLQWRELPACPELEFLAGSSGWAMLPMASLGDAWAGSVVFLGSMGDELWRRDRQDVSSSLSRPRERQPAFAGLREFRLRTGIVFAHVPTIGAVHARAIHRITRSDEMAPWSLGNDYDRPVPRRIVEDAGIPREAFGHTIHMTIDTQTPEILRRLRRSSFAAFVNDAADAIPGPLRRRLAFEWRWGPTLILAAKGLARALHSAGRRLRVGAVQRIGKMMIIGIVRWQWHEPMPIQYTFHWGTAALIRRYREAAGEESRVQAAGAARRRPAEDRAG